jgi:hypothetical protein
MSDAYDPDDSTEPPEDDYDDEPATGGKEEPDCESCYDSGCPGCGYVNAQDPEHLRFLAEQIIRSRLDINHSPTAATADELDQVLSTAVDVDEASREAVGLLVESALVTVTVTWPTPGSGWSTEQPF